MNRLTVARCVAFLLKVKKEKEVNTNKDNQWENMLTGHIKIMTPN